MKNFLLLAIILVQFNCYAFSPCARHQGDKWFKNDFFYKGDLPENIHVVSKRWIDDSMLKGVLFNSDILINTGSEPLYIGKSFKSVEETEKAINLCKEVCDLPYESEANGQMSDLNGELYKIVNGTYYRHRYCKRGCGYIW